MADSMVSKILVAPPNLKDEAYEKTVILIAAQDVHSRLFFGTILNRPLERVYRNVFEERLNRKFPKDWRSFTFYHGGNSAQNHLFLLHSDDYKDRQTLWTNQALGFTVVNDRILANVVSSKTPSRFLVAAGTMTRSPEILASECAHGIWGVLPFDIDLVFPADRTKLWERCRDRVRESYGAKRDFNFDAFSHLRQQRPN